MWCRYIRDRNSWQNPQTVESRQNPSHNRGQRDALLRGCFSKKQLLIFVWKIILPKIPASERLYRQYNKTRVALIPNNFLAAKGRWVFFPPMFSFYVSWILKLGIFATLQNEWFAPSVNELYFCLCGNQCKFLMKLKSLREGKFCGKVFQNIIIVTFVTQSLPSYCVSSLIQFEPTSRLIRDPAFRKGRTARFSVQNYYWALSMSFVTMGFNVTQN